MTGPDRRLVGAMVLILAIIAVVVVPAIDGRRVAGSAVAMVFPPPPQTGDCVQPPFPRDARVAGFPPEIPVDGVDFAPCGGSVAAEVVGVVAADRTGARPEGSSPNQCSLEAAAEYAGLPLSADAPTEPGASADKNVEWRPIIGANMYLLVPGARERAAGHHWAVCVAVPTSNRPYNGSLRRAYAGGSLPDQFGLCWSGADLDKIQSLLPCDRPHPAELMATGWITDRSIVSLAERNESCLTIAGRIMLTNDPTHGGTLRIVMDPVTLDRASTPTDPIAINCFAVAANGARLSHTVIGLGDRPLPLTG